MDPWEEEWLYSAGGGNKVRASISVHRYLSQDLAARLSPHAAFDGILTRIWKLELMIRFRFQVLGCVYIYYTYSMIACHESLQFHKCVFLG